MVLAQELLDTWPDHDAAVAAFVVTHHNLADLHLRAARPDDAVALLCVVHDRMQATIADESLDMALRRTALRHSRQTFSELLLFSQKHGSHPKIAAALARGIPGAGRCAAAEFPLH